MRRGSYGRAFRVSLQPATLAVVRLSWPRHAGKLQCSLLALPHSLNFRPYEACGNDVLHRSGYDLCHILTSEVWAVYRNEATTCNIVTENVERAQTRAC